jgi:hypothetical protein
LSVAGSSAAPGPTIAGTAAPAAAHDRLLAQALSGALSALAWPRQGSSATVAMPASQSRVRAPSQWSTAALVRSATTSSSRPPSRSTSLSPTEWARSGWP